MEHLPLFLRPSPFHHFLPAAVLERIIQRNLCIAKRLTQAESFHPMHGHAVQCCGHFYLAVSVCTTEGHIWLFKIQNTVGNFADCLDAWHACATYERT